MSTVIVTKDRTFHCPSGSACCVATPIEARGFPKSLAPYRPDSVILLGITEPDPLEMACALRRSSACRNTPVAIVAEAGELPGWSEGQKHPLERLFATFVTQLQSMTAQKKRPALRIVVDLRGREIRAAGSRK